MPEIEQYEFDRKGYIVIPGLLTPDQTASLAAAIDWLEGHALEHLDALPRKKSPWGAEYHRDEAYGYHANGSDAEGRTLMIEDFWNADKSFDILVDHERTMGYVREVIQERPTINNSEIRIRYQGNQSGTHGGGDEVSRKYRYRHISQGIDCMMVRMVYFVQDVTNDQGAFCVVPGSHKTSIPAPYGHDPDEDPSMVGLEVKTGDAIFFTENLRHGGFTNHSDQVRKTLHVGYGPYWMMSQNIATMDEPRYITDETFARYTDDQASLFRAWHEMHHRK